MKIYLTLLILMPALVFAQSYPQAAPFILPYQGTIYNGPGLGNQGYMPMNFSMMPPQMPPPMLPMMYQQNWNQPPLMLPQQRYDWTSQPFGPRQPWSPMQGNQGQGSQSRLSSLMLPLMALGLAMFAGMNSDGLGRDSRPGSDDDFADYDQDHGNDARTQAAAPVESCRNCESGIRRTATRPLREVAPRSPPPTPTPTAAAPQAGSRVDFADSADEPAPAPQATAPAPNSPVIAGGVRATPVAAPPRTASTVPGVGTPRRETPQTPSVVPAVNPDERRAQDAPVWNTFMQNLNQCAPGCTPVQYASYGSRTHPTCHSSGRALDVFGIRCGGQVYMAINRGKYDEMVTCMKTKMKVLYRNHPDRNVTDGHRNHAHFSLGCNGGLT